MKPINELNVKDLVLVTKGEDNQYYLGHTFYYGGRDAEYLLFLYKDALPLATKDLVEAWNHLDDTSFTTVIVNETSIQVAVEDFLYAHGQNKAFNEIEYEVVNDYVTLDKVFKNHNPQVQQTIAYIIK